MLRAVFGQWQPDYRRGAARPEGVCDGDFAGVCGRGVAAVSGCDRETAGGGEEIGD